LFQKFSAKNSHYGEIGGGDKLRLEREPAIEDNPKSIISWMFHLYKLKPTEDGAFKREAEIEKEEAEAIFKGETYIYLSEKNGGLARMAILYDGTTMLCGYLEKIPKKYNFPRHPEDIGLDLSFYEIDSGKPINDNDLLWPHTYTAIHCPDCIKLEI
jgi:hypothetical protein